MRIGIAGAGAVGAHYGIMLQRDGHAVHFLARAAHLYAMQNSGLKHIAGDEQHILTVSASDNPSILAHCEVVVLACKVTDLDSMLVSVAPHIDADTLLVTLQNGVVAPELTAKALPQYAVAAGTAFIGARIEEPGVVIHSAAGGVRLGVWQRGKGEERFAPLIQAFVQAGVPARAETDVRLMLWRKLLWNCGFNAITAITRCFAKDIAANAETLAIVRKAMTETVMVANALGIKIGEEAIHKHIQVTLEMGAVKTSMWQDIQRGKPTEVDYINGFVADQAASLGMDAPVNRMLTTLLHAIEQG